MPARTPASLLSVLLGLLIASGCGAQDAPQTTTIDITNLVTGTDAANPGLVEEVVRVAVIGEDPRGTVRLGPDGRTLELTTTFEGLLAGGGMIRNLADRPADERVTPEMLYVEGRPSRDGIGRRFFGREIAQVMGHLGASWLERPTREREERTSLLVELLEVDVDTDVADIGAGTGYFTFPIARRASEGTVLAVDIQPEMLEFIEARKRDSGISNVEGRLGTITDVGLEPECIDLAFAVDAYHEFSNPWEMLRSIHRALRPGGRLVLVEYRLEDPEVPIKLVHKMSQAQVRRELEAAGYEWVTTKDDLPWQHVLVFRKPPAVGSPEETGPDATPDLTPDR